MVPTLLASLLLGLLGRVLKPVAFLAATAPALAAAAAFAAWQAGLSGLEAAGRFYASVTVAELAYLGALLAGVRLRLRPAQDRSA